MRWFEWVLISLGVSGVIGVIVVAGHAIINEPNCQAGYVKVSGKCVAGYDPRTR